jgi:hypothetical protein
MLLTSLPTLLLLLIMRRPKRVAGVKVEHAVME